MAYRDPTPISPKQIDYDKSKVDPRVSNYTKQVRDKQHGIDTREAMARAEEISSVVSTEAKELSEKTKVRQDVLEKQFDEQIENMTLEDPSSAEMVAAHVNANTGESWTTIGRRLDDENKKVNEQLATKATESRVQKLQDDLTGLHKLTYKSVSVHVGLNGYKKPDISIWRHLKTQGASATLIVMVGITSETDDNPQMFDDTLIQEAINDANSVGVVITMIKLHLGINFSDGFNRGNYLPANIQTYFSNWQSICLHYADLCDQYEIPVLCIGCEQPNQTLNEYVSNWESIVTSIKAKHPNLLLTYAPKTWEAQAPQNQEINSVLDIIGYNVYLTYTQKLLSEETPKLDELAKAFWWQNDGLNVIDTLNELSERFQKPVFITEIGCMPIDNGLTSVVPPNYETQPQNFNAVYWLMKASFDVLFRENNVIGFAWWSAEPPFTYYSENTITSAEQIMIDYVKGGGI
jgi:hypothetical protein